MYADALIIERPDRAAAVARRIALGETAGRDEAWLRDTLLAHPEAPPIGDIDPSFGPLVPLCRELRTSAGPIDFAFVNPNGLLTLVECKLWRNPQARREVVAQVLHYAQAVTRWSDADLQRQVSMATRETGNVPFERARRLRPDLAEARFIHATARAMKAGRFLLVIAGDGIREDVSALTQLINRNAALAFHLALVEVGLYYLGAGALAIQPRTLARTHVLERSVVLVTGADEASPTGAAVEPGGDEDEATPPARSVRDYRPWWVPLLERPFDDPEQEPLRYFHPSNARARLPWPGLRFTLYRAGNPPRCGLFLSGWEEAREEALRRLRPEREAILGELATVAEFGWDGNGLSTVRAEKEFDGEDAIREWLWLVANHFVNTIRPRLLAFRA